MIVDWLNIQHTMALSHVCVRWHAVARAHPTFWRDIRLAAVSNAALDFFRARLDSSEGRNVCICMRLADYPICDRIEEVVIPAVTRSSLDMHSTTAPHLFSGILDPAPLLENLELRFFLHLKGQPVAILPANLLGGVCPRLEDLSLTSVMFPPERIPVYIPCCVTSGAVAFFHRGCSISFPRWRTSSSWATHTFACSMRMDRSRH